LGVVVVVMMMMMMVMKMTMAVLGPREGGVHPTA
jgi:hypothetical protein